MKIEIFGWRITAFKRKTLNKRMSDFSKSQKKKGLCVKCTNPATTDEKGKTLTTCSVHRKKLNHYSKMRNRKKKLLIP